MLSCCLLNRFTVREKTACLQVRGAMLPKDISVSPTLRNLSLTPLAHPGALSSLLWVCSVSSTSTISAYSFVCLFVCSLQFYPRSSLIWLLPRVLHWISIPGLWLPQSSELEVRWLFHFNFKRLLLKRWYFKHRSLWGKARNSASLSAAFLWLRLTRNRLFCRCCRATQASGKPSYLLRVSQKPLLISFWLILLLPPLICLLLSRDLIRLLLVLLFGFHSCISASLSLIFLTKY